MEDYEPTPEEREFWQAFRAMLPKKTVKIPRPEKVAAALECAKRTAQTVEEGVSHLLFEGEESPVSYALETGPLLDAGLTLTANLPDYGGRVSVKKLRALLDICPDDAFFSLWSHTDGTVDLSLTFPEVFEVIPWDDGD